MTPATPEAIDAAVTAYLATGDDDERAGTCRSPRLCPVARALPRRTGGVTRHLIFLWVWERRGVWKTVLVLPTLRVSRFIAAVDAEPGRFITKGRTRVLWTEAKGE